MRLGRLAIAMAVVMVLGAVVPAAAEAGLVAQFSADRDNWPSGYNNRSYWDGGDVAASTPSDSYQAYMCDWSDADLTELKKYVDGTYTPPPGKQYEIRFAVCANDWGCSPVPDANIEVWTFQNSQDWTLTGADQYRSGSGNWDSGNIFSLPGVVNGELIVNWNGPSTGSGGGRVWNEVVLDTAFVVDLTDLTDVAGDGVARGVVLKADPNVTENCMGRNKWGAGGRLQVFEIDAPLAVIPEPAGLGLMGLALLAIRRKRS